MLLDICSTQSKIKDLQMKSCETDMKLFMVCDKLNAMIFEHEKQITQIQTKLFPAKKSNGSFLIAPLCAMIGIVVVGRLLKRV